MKNNIHSSLFFPEVLPNQHFDICILDFDELHLQICKNEAAMEGKEMQEKLNDRYNLGEPKSIRAMPMHQPNTIPQLNTWLQNRKDNCFYFRCFFDGLSDWVFAALDSCSRM